MWRLYDYKWQYGRYSPSGRLRKNIVKSGKRRVEFMQLHAEKEPYRRETPDYPSAPLTPYKPRPRDDWKVSIFSIYYCTCI